MERIAAEFGEGKSLYDVLEIPSTASSSEVKKAYFKIALKCVSRYEASVWPPTLSFYCREDDQIDFPS